MAIPPGLTRDDVTITLDYMTGQQVHFTVRDHSGKKLGTATGKAVGSYVDLHKTAQGRRDPDYPSYQLIVVDGVTEVVENWPYRSDRNMVQNGHTVALFSFVDDPELKRKLLAAGLGHK